MSGSSPNQLPDSTGPDEQAPTPEQSEGGTTADAPETSDGAMHPAVARALEVSQRKPRWRERISDRLDNWPILRMLVLNPLFGGISLILFLGMLLPSWPFPRFGGSRQTIFSR